MAKTALILIDFQNDYFSNYDSAKFPLSGTEVAASQGAKLLAAFRKRKLPVVHVRHEFLNNDAPFFLPGSEGAKIHPSVTDIIGESAVLKHQINSFRDTNLKAILDEQDVENVVIVGAMTHMCVDAVTRAAKDLGYNCAIAHDACATLDLEFNGVKVPAEHVHAAFMAALKFAYAHIASADELIKDLS
jgi:nicotinamidase-related amidase